MKKNAAAEWALLIKQLTGTAAFAVPVLKEFRFCNIKKFDNLAFGGEIV